MQSAFYELADALFQGLSGDEVLLLAFDGERSDFVRLNHNRVRQAGQVEQRALKLQLIQGSRHASATVFLAGDAAVDRERAGAALGSLREQIPHLAPDPHLLYNTEVTSSEHCPASGLPEAGQAIEEIIATGEGLDLVGIWASGGVFSGFANSLGQRNWFGTYSFNFDWSLYHQADKAVKCGYAGTEWRGAELQQRMDRARTQLDVLQRPARTIDPGQYRVWLAPSALQEILGLLAWGGFSLKAQRSKRSSLLRAVEGRERFSEAVSLSEHTGAGLSPTVQSQGFLRPARVPLVTAGAYADALVSPRSAREYGVSTNGADAHEMPQSLEMEAGTLATSEVPEALGTGVWINNLWYLNYSDRTACRATGMTRFATLWVENGQVVAPLNVMRFDDSIYRLLGDRLVSLGKERELLLESGTYGKRNTGGMLLPGALVDGLTFTL
jgi:predicted Zn-dependent protease